MASEKTLFESIEETAAEYRHELLLRGKKRVECSHCAGTGDRIPGYSDADAHGSFWVSGIPCRFCSGGLMEVPASAEEQLGAVWKEINTLQVKAKYLRKEIRRGTKTRSEVEG